LHQFIAAERPDSAIKANNNLDVVSLRELFRLWMLEKGLSEKTARSYSGAAITLCDKYIQNINLNVKSFFQLTSNQVLDALKELEKVDEWVQANNNGNSMYSSACKKLAEFLNEKFCNSFTRLSKPFLLLAGISGTGKSRFVREQAKQSSGEDDPSNYALISVRPDWHEPSDLLGYVSRLGENAPNFVSTPTLKFMVKAWKVINPSPDELSANRFIDKSVLPYWLCLDEMNLAPVEQYFADYLSVVETREWTDEGYRCAPLLKADVISGLSDKGKEALKKDLGLEKDFDSLWNYFTEKGIPLPYNLIVAGTVNMDETTHGFSRKVIDRALTVDFGEFFPNDLNAFFSDEPQKQPIVLGYPIASEARDKTEVADKSRQFLKALNEGVLKGTSFEVAFRALNELLLSVRAVNPSDTEPAKLLAVWDDFLMMKVLPRIEGDRDKVEQVLEDLKTTLASQLSDIWSDEQPGRPDLWRETTDLIACRSKAKIKWMQDRLDKSGFTSFWP
jgi:hypothetical protein